jgi:hypothetical protein
MILVLLAVAVIMYYASQTQTNIQPTTLPQQSTLTLTPKSGSPSVTILISGSGYTTTMKDCTDAFSAEPSTLFSGGTVTFCRIDEEGNLTGQFTVSADAPLGAYLVTAAGKFVRQGAVSAPFTVTEALTPKLVLSRATGSGGDNVTFTGSGFNPENKECRLNFYRIQETIEAQECHTSAGVVNGWFIVKTLGNPAGSREIKVAGNLLDTATTIFTVIPRILITPNPTFPESVLTVSGSNYVIVGDCSSTANWPGLPASITVMSCTIDENYLATATLHLASSAPPATYMITLSDGIVQASTSVTIQQPSSAPEFLPIMPARSISKRNCQLPPSASTP